MGSFTGLSPTNRFTESPKDSDSRPPPAQNSPLPPHLARQSALCQSPHPSSPLGTPIKGILKNSAPSPSTTATFSKPLSSPPLERAKRPCVTFCVAPKGGTHIEIIEEESTLEKPEVTKKKSKNKRRIKYNLVTGKVNCNIINANQNRVMRCNF